MRDVTKSLVCSLTIHRSETNAAHQEYHEKVATARKAAATMIAATQAIYAAYLTAALSCRHRIDERGAVGLTNYTVTMAVILTVLENKKKAAEKTCNIKLKKTNDARKSKTNSFLNPSIR